MSLQFNPVNKQPVNQNNLNISIPNSWTISLNGKTEDEYKLCPEEKNIPKVLTLGEINKKLDVLNNEEYFLVTIENARIISTNYYGNSNKKITSKDKKKLDDGRLNVKASFMKAKIALKNKNRDVAMSALVNTNKQFEKLSNDLDVIGKRLDPTFEVRKKIKPLPGPICS